MRAVSPAVLAVFTLVTRVLFHGPIYFADGPSHIASIADKTYIIQPPGYWLFNRIAGLFRDPTLAISVMNILFSVAGVVMFYYTALFFTRKRNAFLAALAYSSIFFVWFSGEVHSSYASQILFPVATFYSILRFERDQQDWALWLAAVLFAVGAGLRPSDGAFLIPMVVYYAATRLPLGKALGFLALISAMCLAWLLPTYFAYRAISGVAGAAAYFPYIMQVSSIVKGVSAKSLANIARYLVPLVLACWAVLATATVTVFRNWSDWRTRMLVLWIVPGSLFFVLSFFGDATYLNFLMPAVLLLAVSAPRLLTVTAVWNAAFFLLFTPIPSKKLPVNVLNIYAGKFTRCAVSRQWQPTLSAVQREAVSSCGQH